MSWKYLQYDGETGKKRTVNGGSGGASELNDLEDVNVSSPSDGQILKYDNSSSKWINADNSSGGHTYSTTEHVIGTWIDGKPIYEKTVDLSANIEITAGSWVDTIMSKNNIHIITGVKGISEDGVCWDSLNARAYTSASNYVQIWNLRGSSFWIRYLVIQYTKTTDV